MVTKTTSGSGFDMKFRLLAPGFLLESGFVVVYTHVLSHFILELSYFNATPRRNISKWILTNICAGDYVGVPTTVQNFI